LFDQKNAATPTDRVYRGGGSWGNDGDFCRAVTRGWALPTAPDLHLGLRLARVPSGTPSPEAKTPDKGPAPAEAPAWTVLTPVEMKSEGGATLTLQDDRSVLVSGEQLVSDVYTLTFRELPTRIHSLRLEALPHVSLPNNGPGRHSNPDLYFGLTTIKVELDQ